MLPLVKFCLLIMIRKHVNTLKEFKWQYGHQTFFFRTSTGKNIEACPIWKNKTVWKIDWKRMLIPRASTICLDYHLVTFKLNLNKVFALLYTRTVAYAFRTERFGFYILFGRSVIYPFLNPLIFAHVNVMGWGVVGARDIVIARAEEIK